MSGDKKLDFSQAPIKCKKRGTKNFSVVEGQYLRSYNVTKSYISCC